MITQPFVSGGGFKEEIWEITVNTEATASGAKTTGIPINLFSQPGITMTVDWGDGTESVLTSASYSSASDSAPSVHEYATAGTYIVRMKSTKWKDAYIEVLNSGSTGALIHIAGFRSTLVGVGQLPRCKGTLYRRFSSASGVSKAINRLSFCFRGCSKLTSIPNDLFYNNLSVTDFSSCFYGCSNLTSIPNDLFYNNLSVTDFSSCFYDCSNLTSIPNDLFANNPKVTNFGSCFYGCSNLTSIPNDLFANNPKVTNFGSCFRGCSNLTSIPNDLFYNNLSVTDFSSCFSGCSKLTSIPNDLFYNNLSVTDFSSCFYDCSNLTSIPAGLFDNNSKATNFVSCFDSCSSLTSIPAGLFDNNPNVTSFACCFWQCRKLQSIPSGLFHNNSKVTDFHMTFFSCSISDIPVELFANCPAVTDLSGTFGDNPITSVPSGLFSSQTLVTTLGNIMNTPNGIFSAGFGYRGVIAIDENLFAHMLNLTQARFAFQGHYGFSIRFRATGLTDVTAFCDKNTEHPVTVYVPAGSATAEAFHAIANTNGIIVVEE